MFVFCLVRGACVYIQPHTRAKEMKSDGETANKGNKKYSTTAISSSAATAFATKKIRSEPVSFEMLLQNAQRF